MEAMDAIFGRRSIRQFAAGEVPADAVETMLRAGMAAPSAGNQQPWHFVVIEDRSILDRVPDVHPYSRMILDAPLAILVCADTAKLGYPHHWPQDCSAATQNVLLAVHALGFGSVWLGVYPDKDRMAGIAKLVGLPPGIEPFSLLPIGVPGEKKLPAERFDGARVHKNVW